MNKLPAIFENINGLSIEEIIFFESESNYTNVHGNRPKPVLLANTLKYFEDILLPQGFLRIHRSYLVNIQHIRHDKLKKSRIMLSNGMELKVARRRIKSLNNYLYQAKIE